MNCPACNVALDERNYQGLEVDHCPQCKGLWLDFDELDLLEDTANRSDVLEGDARLCPALRRATLSSLRRGHGHLQLPGPRPAHRALPQ